jgi:hypothetical protein
MVTIDIFMPPAGHLSANGDSEIFNFAMHFTIASFSMFSDENVVIRL